MVSEQVAVQISGTTGAAEQKKITGAQIRTFGLQFMLQELHRNIGCRRP